MNPPRALGVDALELGMEHVRPLALRAFEETAANRERRGGPLEEPLFERAHVEPRSSDHEGNGVPPAHVLHGGARERGISRGAERLRGIGDVDEMVPNRRSLRSVRLRRSRVEPPVDLARVGPHDFHADTLGHEAGHCRLRRARGPHDARQKRGHVRSNFASTVPRPISRKIGRP
jgi:hypothetical protein